MSVADDAKETAKAPSSLDAQLLQDLDSDLLEGLSESLGDDPGSVTPKLAPAEASPERSESKIPREPPVRLDEKKLLNDLTEGEDIGAPNLAEDDADPLTRIEQKMRQVEQRLAQRDASDATQTLQRQIAEELAALLEQLRQQQQQQQQNQNPNNSQQQQSASSSNRQEQQSASSNPSSQAAQKPAEDSEERQGKLDEERINPENLRELFQRAWGHLPPQVREQMQAAAEEQFLPQYETLIEDYFKRLAEEGRR